VRVHSRRELEDAELTRALVAHEHHAARALLQRFRPVVFRILRRKLGPDQDMEDLAQEIFLCVFDKVPTLREPSALGSFIISIVMLTARSELRRRWMRRLSRLAPKDDVDKEAFVSVDIEAREALRRFYGVLDRLNTDDRRLFILRFIDELSLLQLADEFGLSLATTKRRLIRVRSRVRLLIERDPVLCEYVSCDVDSLNAGKGSVRWPPKVVERNHLGRRWLRGSTPPTGASTPYPPRACTTTDRVDGRAIFDAV
jgi:RNA polymerase sigma-70 factor (ECF subfamily)